MKKSLPQEEIIDQINMTPLIDIMLVLLIIFMVTSSLSLESSLDIELPRGETSSSVKSKAQSAVIVTLWPDNRIAVQGQEVSWENATSAITKALAKEKTELVILEGDKSSNLGRAVTIMNMAKTAGAKQFAIATDDE